MQVMSADHQRPSGKIKKQMDIHQLPDDGRRPAGSDAVVDHAVALILSMVEVRLANVETTLVQIISAVQAPQHEQEWYSTGEIAEALGKSEFTVREWCRHGRIHAEKRACAAGLAKEWPISNAELQRIRNEGLLPDQTAYRHRK